MGRESWAEDESIEWMEYNVVCQDKAIFESVRQETRVHDAALCVM